MSDEPFLTRWSRRKRQPEGRLNAPEQQPKGEEESVAPDTEPAKVVLQEQGPTAASAEQIVDFSALPPLDSITAETDIRGFLAPGVPAEIRRAALRRAWSADATIRDFIGLTENDWDVLAPAAAGGVEPLAATEHMHRLIEQMFSRDVAGDSQTSVTAPDQSIAIAKQTAGAASAAEGQAETQHEDMVDAAAAATPPTIGGRASADDIAVQQKRTEPALDATAGRRGHGRALPK